MWSTGEETSRVLAFLALVRLVRLKQEDLLEKTLKVRTSREAGVSPFSGGHANVDKVSPLKISFSLYSIVNVHYLTIVVVVNLHYIIIVISDVHHVTIVVVNVWVL